VSAQQLQEVLDLSEPEDLCHCLWALTKLGAPCQQLLWQVTGHSLDRGGCRC